jgi:hypothetical protein
LLKREKVWLSCLVDTFRLSAKSRLRLRREKEKKSTSQLIKHLVEIQKANFFDQGPNSFNNEE